MPHQGGNPVLSAQPDREPVQNLQHVNRYVTELWYLANKAGRRALNMVKAGQSHRWQTSMYVYMHVSNSIQIRRINYHLHHRAHGF